MKVKIEFYKQRGKWYANDEINLPDETNLWDDNLVELILKTQTALTSGKEFMIRVTISEKEAVRLNGKFFDAILNIKDKHV